MTLVTLLLALAFAVSLAFGLMSPATRASAVTYGAGEIFSAGTGGTVDTGSAEGESENYIRFKFNAEGEVYFRRDLALKWFAPVSGSEEPEETEEGGPVNPGQLRYFSMTFAFDGLNFKRFSVEFESAEENISKESTSKNALVFFKDGDDVTAAIRNASEQVKDDEVGTDKDTWASGATKIPVDASGDLEITLNETDCSIGEFGVCVNGTLVGKITNVGGYYLEYLSSASSTPRDPMKFRADELAEGATEQIVLVKALNGQSFSVTNERIEDNAAPVLVVNEQIYAYTLGRRWSLTYEAIDVCDSSVTVTRRYAMLKIPDEGEEYKKPVLTASEGVTSDYNSLTTSTFFMPTSDKGAIRQYVSIYFDLDDGRSRDDAAKEAEYIYLTWYAVDEAVETLGEGEEAFDYIIVDREQKGPAYVGVTADEESKTNIKDPIADELAAEYQEQVTKASEGLSAGDGAYFYLPSLRGLIDSDYADYRNLRFSIYYYKPGQEVDSTATSATTLRYNALRFEIDRQGKYLFKILAADASSNSMMYYVDEELVTVNSNNIWDIEEIPEFEFEVGYTGATIEKPGEQTRAYRLDTCTISSFDIIALEGYETEYTLYRFDSTKLPEGVVNPSYSDFVKNAKSYMTKYAEYIEEISVFNSDVTEDDETRWNNTDNAYHWDPDSSLSFVPQEMGFYIVKVVVTEAALPGHQPEEYQVIEVVKTTDQALDETYWLENNIASVVLFSISAFLLIIIVIVFVVKPSDKNVEEVDLAKLKGKKDPKNKK